MAELEQLEIVIDVIDQFEEELNRLLLKLAEVETAVQLVDDIRIDVDVRGEHELDTLVARLSALEAMDLSGVGDIVVGDKNIRRSGGGGSARLSSGTRRRIDSLTEGLADVTKKIDESLSDIAEGSQKARRGLNRTGDAGEEAAEGLFRTDLRMTDLHNALARIVPLLLVIIGALPALISALVGLAAAAIAATAALGALTAFGALGFAAEMGDGEIGAGFEEILREVREDFLDAFMPLAERLAPLFEDALEGLGRFFQAVANEGDALTQLSDEARDFGDFLMETLPSFIADLALFTAAMSEAFGYIAAFGGEIDIFQSLAAYVYEVLPAFMHFLQLLTAILPHIARMSIGFLEVTNALLALFNIFMDVVTVGGLLDKQLGLIVATLITVYGITVLLSGAMSFLYGKVMISVGKSVLGAVSAFTSLSYSEWMTTAATYGLADAFVALAGAIALTGIGAIAVVLGSIASAGISASNGIDEATSSLEQLRRQQNRMSSGNNPYADPDIQGTEGVGRSRFASNNVNVTVMGDADKDTLGTQTQNALYRVERPRRGR